MEIILLKDVERLGKSGEIVTVKDGYSRNFLIPRKLAMPVTPGNLKVIESKQRAKEAKEGAKRKSAEAMSSKLQGTSYTISVKAGPDDKLYGAVTASDIAKALEAEEITVDKKTIEIQAPIKELGVYNVLVRLGPEITQKIKVWIVKE